MHTPFCASVCVCGGGGGGSVCVCAHMHAWLSLPVNQVRLDFLLLPCTALIRTSQLSCLGSSVHRASSSYISSMVWVQILSEWLFEQLFFVEKKSCSGLSYCLALI